jgi:hypothetical protein
LQTFSASPVQMARRLLKHICVEALANGEQARKTQTNVGCEMATLLLIAFILSLGNTDGGKAGW